MSTLRAGDREFHTLEIGQVLTATAAAASAGLVRQYPQSSYDALQPATVISAGATVAVGPFTGSVVLGVECSAGTVAWSAAVPATGAGLDPTDNAGIQALVSGDRNQIPRRVLGFGTSITNFWGDTGAAASQRQTNASSYLGWFVTAMRGAIKPENVINKGVSGNTTTQMLARFAADVQTANFDVMIFEPGPNDYPANFTAATVQANIAAIVGGVQAMGRPVIVLVPTLAESWTSAQYAVFQEVRNWLFANYNGQQPGVRLVDVASLLSDPLTGLPLSALYRPISVEAQRIHPSMSGAHVMGRAIAESFPTSRSMERQITPGGRDHYELIANSRLQGNNASAARNFFAAAGVTVTGGPDSAGIAITQGTFTSVTIAPVTADGSSIGAPAGGTRLTLNTAGSDRSFVTLRVGTNDSIVGGTQFGRYDQNWAATTAQVFGDHRPLAASPDGVLTCIVGGTTGGTAPAAPAAYGMTVTDGTVTWMWQKMPTPGDVVVAEVEYEIESVNGGVAIKTAAQIARTAGTEMFVYGQAGAFDASVTVTDGAAGLWMPRRGVLTSLPLTLTTLGFNVRHAWVDIIIMLPAAGSATVRLDRVSLRRIA